MVRLPSPGQQVIHTIHGMIGDAGQHVAQVGLGIETIELGGFDQRVDCRSALAAGIGAGEEIVLAAEGYRPFILPMSVRN
jgi:hypothetical protein